MPAIPFPIITALATLDGDHAFGHRCADGRWYNPPVKGVDCAIKVAGAELRAYLDTQAAAVHTAAHDPDAARAVAEGMTGLVMGDLSEEDREGWTLTARYAIEALSAWLDGPVAETPVTA